MHRYYDEDESHSIGILQCEGTPQEGFRTYSTVGAHESPNFIDDADVRVELAGVAPADLTLFPNLLATAAFQLIKENWLAAPGVVFPGVVKQFNLSDTLEHVLWAEPFPWEDLGSVEASQQITAHWLLAILISESERKFLQQQGYFALEALFEQHEIPYYDLDRVPVA
ncbi:suppressor of fused domain protein [Saccharopolyspora sp. NPDC047091]|uniref:suppressor of fused domain protein n=1 Tax=Saccharopolyspora sp. NPDC047091 TaxID=3155924 RepID=UPI0033C2CCD3